MTWRHEWKHEIIVSDLLQLRQRLGAVMEKDSHAADGKYEIRSWKRKAGAAGWEISRVRA